MSTEPQSPLGIPSLAYVEAQTGRTVRSSTAARIAQAGSLNASGRPARRAQIHSAYPNGATPRTYVVSYTRTTNATRHLYVAAHARAVYFDEALTIDLTIKDAAGHSVASSSALIPAFLKGTAWRMLDLAFDIHEIGSGYLDINALAATLTDADWSLEFAVAVALASPNGTHLLCDMIEVWEVPRSRVDTDDAAGALVGPLMPGNAITSGATSGASGDGWVRIEATLAGARTSQRTYAQECFGPDDVTATLPSTASAAYVALTNLEESAGTSIGYTFRVRTVTGSAGGEVARARFRYIVAGGGNANIKVTSTIAGYATGTLASATWAWSPWLAVMLKASATGHIETVTITGKVSAGTLYVSGWILEENVS